MVGASNDKLELVLPAAPPSVAAARHALTAYAEHCGWTDLWPIQTAVSEAVLGPDYQIVEIGFDVPFEGARNQPWHRDFPSPPDTYEDRRITSLAFNMTGVDVTEDMGPFEIAQGTQYEDGRAWKHEMFPPKDEWPRFAERGVRKFPKRGDISARSALTIHRGWL